MKKSNYYILLLAIFLFSFFYNFYFMKYGISFLGEGYWAYTGKELAEGKVPFRDVILWGHAPGQFYFPVFFMKFFGYNLFAERLYYVLAGSLFAVVIFLISKKLTG